MQFDASLDLARLRRTLDALSPAGGRLWLALILVAALLVRLCFIAAPGYTDDITIFVKWYESALAYPPSQLYARDPSINYPPAFLVVLELAAGVYRTFVHADPQHAILTTYVKALGIAFDLVAATLAYILVRRLASPSAALAAAAYFAFSPAIVYISGYWGQCDSLPVAFALGAVLLLFSANATLAWPLLAFATLIKPPILLLVPLFLLYPLVAPDAAERKRRSLGAAAGILLSLAMCEALALVFFPQPAILASSRDFIIKVARESAVFHFTSLDAFNLWALFGDFFASDRVRWGPLYMQYWAQLLFVAVAAAIYGAYAVRRSKTAFLEAAVLVFLAFFLFMPEMHERYSIYATMFAGVLLYRRPYAIAAAVLSITTLLSLEYALTNMLLSNAHVTAVNINEFAPCLVRVCALANLAVFFWPAARYLAPLAQPRTTGWLSAAGEQRAVR